MKRRPRALRLAMFLTAGAMIFQIGPCVTMGLGAGTSAINPSTLFLDENGSLFGIFHLCGEPNIRLIDQNGAIVSEYNTEDDLIYGCPFTEQVTSQSGGT